MAINDNFVQIYQKYKQCPTKDKRESYVKQIIAAAYLMTQYNADTNARNCVLAIGNRFRKSEYKKLTKSSLRKLWRIANQPTGKEIKHINKFIDLLIKGKAEHLFDRPRKPQTRARAPRVTPVVVVKKRRGISNVRAQ